MKISLFFKKNYGEIYIPEIPHHDRVFGGHLIVDPAKPKDGKVFHHVSEMIIDYPIIWKRYHLLCAIAEKALLDVIDCLKDGKGIINLFEAGNWGVHFNRADKGEKDADKKRVHAHIYGRSQNEGLTKPRTANNWGWGEAPQFPDFDDTPFSISSTHKWQYPDQFNDDECKKLKKRIEELFKALKNKIKSRFMCF